MARFEEVVGPHLNAAYELARWLLRDAVEAEDALQEASMRALRAYEGVLNPRAWLLTIVRNVCFSRMERREVPNDDAAVVHLQRHPNPDAALESAAIAHNINEAVAALPPEFREVFVLRELEGLSYKEIADVAQIPMGTVMSRLSRAREALQAALLRKEQVS
jgi:RNA polymerase sigma factor (sigma-70 family)